MLALAEQCVTPLQRRAQGLLPLRRATLARGQQPQPFVQRAAQCLDPQVRHSRRGQLDGQRQPVKLSADVHHRGDVVGAELEVPVRRLRPLDEQRDRTVREGKAATAAKAAHQKEQRLLDQHELDLTVLQLAQEALSDYGAGTLPREVRPPIVKALPIGDVPTLVALERVGVDGDLRAVGLAFAGSQGIDFVMGLLPRVELIRPVDRLPDSVTRTQLVQPDFLFMRGVFHYAGLLEQEWDTIFSQDDATIRRLAEASERLNTTLKASWSQGRRLEFLLVHNSSSKRIELRIKDPAVQQQYVRASRRSSGFTHFFALKTILHAHEVEAPARSYIWVFDEPGVFLHPDGQHDLVQVMETLAQSNQVVYSTHSVFMANKNYPARHRLVVKTVGGTTLDGKPFRSRWRPAIEALGMSMPGTLLFASSVLIVEGDSDVILLNATLQFLIRIGKLDRDLNALGILAAGDSADAAALVRILKESTAAPRVAALFDGDSGGERRRKSLEGLGRSDLKIRLLTPKDSATEDHLPAACDLYPVALARYLAKISPRTAPDGSRLTEAQFLAEIEGRRTELETTKEGLTSGMADWARRIGREIGELDEEPSAVGLGREYALVLEDRPDDLGGGEAIRRSVQLARWIGETLDLPSLTLTGGAILVSQDVVEAELA